MHNLKEIRKDFDAFKKALEKRSIDLDFNKLKELDSKNRDFIQKRETLEKEKKDISKSKDEKMLLTEKMSGTTFRVQKTLAESIMTETPELIETIIANPEIRRVAEELWKDIGRLLTSVQESKTEEVIEYIKNCQERLSKHTDLDESYKKLSKMVKSVEK